MWRLRLFLIRHGWVTAGVHDLAKRRLRRERVRARQAEALLREGAALLRDDPSMQHWRQRAIDQLEEYGRWNADRARPSLLDLEEAS